MPPKHRAIFVDNRSGKSELITCLLDGPLPQEFTDLAGKQGALFSRIEIDRYIEEEERHDRKILTRNTSQSLQSMSSGERKKALLEYLLETKPDYLVLDNPFDNLDRASQISLKSILEDMSSTTTIILFISRTIDLLPFVEHLLFLDGSNLKPLKRDGELQSRNKAPNTFLAAALPQPPEPEVFDGDFLIEMRDVSVSYYDKPILNSISWKVRPGEFWELAGENGSGKTTLLSMITGDNPKGYGQELYLFGQRKGSGESVWEIKRRIGYFTPAMIDRFGGYHSLENMLISGLTDSIGLYVRPTEAQLRLAGNWLLLLGLESLKDTYFHELGTGIKRLVMCARAMIKHPLLLILDEPTAGLDDESAALFVSLVNKIGRESKTTVIFVSHRPEPGLEAERVFQLEMSAEGSVGKVVAGPGKSP